MQNSYLRFFLCALCGLSLSFTAYAQKILFDATKAEMAGNADWVIDADVHNISTGTGGVMVAGSGCKSNPQRYPTPDQNTVTSTTPETYWEGALSNWAIDMVKLGYQVETLPYNDSITYGMASHPQDLSNYKVFVIDEPNIRFTSAEKSALLEFVRNGGGLFMISDHNGSDRNNDGWDSPNIWNDFFTDSALQLLPFGIKFDLLSFSETSTNITNLPADSCLDGVEGNAAEIMISSGTSMTLYPSINSTVTGDIYRTGANNTDTLSVLLAHARFGKGKVVGLGDSSPPDDGSGNPCCTLYNGYTSDASGNHEKFLVNSTVWLAAADSTLITGISDTYSTQNVIDVFPNPVINQVMIHLDSGQRKMNNEQVSILIYNVLGERVCNLKSKIQNPKSEIKIDVSGFAKGVYIIQLSEENKVYRTKILKE